MTTMVFKKETKHTVVYTTDDPLAPVDTVYVSKAWLAGTFPNGFPQEINLEVGRLSADPRVPRIGKAR